MDFSLPREIGESLERFGQFLSIHMIPHLSKWYEGGSIPRKFFQEMGRGEWLAFNFEDGQYREQSTLLQAALLDKLARLSPGVAVAVLAQTSLGMKGLSLFGTLEHKSKYLGAAGRGEILVCVGNTEARAGSDVAGISAKVEKAEGGWVLNGTKAYVTNGAVSDYAVVTAVSDPEAERNGRLSMFLVDLQSEGVSRVKLNKQVWIPSDLTRLQFRNVFIPEEDLMGQRGRGLQQILEIFTNSRITISALTLGTAAGAFQLALDHAGRREIFGRKIVDFQAKAFEIADFYSKLEAAKLALWKACWTSDQGRDFRLESSVAKYLTVQLAFEVGRWAADLFGAASVIFDHPIHKYPMDAWASSLGEGTQDIQKLIIFREIMKGNGAI